MNALDVISWVCLMGGVFFCFVGGVGLLRLPDLFSRMHGSSMTDTLGSALILIGLMFQAGLSLVTVKLVMILFFMLLTSPTSTHALAKSAFDSGFKPWVKKQKDVI